MQHIKIHDPRFPRTIHLSIFEVLPLRSVAMISCSRYPLEYRNYGRFQYSPLNIGSFWGLVGFIGKHKNYSIQTTPSYEILVKLVWISQSISRFSPEGETGTYRGHNTSIWRKLRISLVLNFLSLIGWISSMNLTNEAIYGTSWGHYTAVSALGSFWGHQIFNGPKKNYLRLFSWKIETDCEWFFMQ